MIAPMSKPKRKHTDAAIRAAYLAGLNDGCVLGEGIADWIEGKDGRMAKQQIIKGQERITQEVEDGAKPWKDQPDEPSISNPCRRPSGVGTDHPD